MLLNRACAMDTTFVYGPALSYLTEEDQQKYSAEFKRYLQKAWREDVALNELKGYYLLTAFEPVTAQYAYNLWNPNADDVIVASYAKTGKAFVLSLWRNILGASYLQCLLQTLRYTLGCLAGSLKLKKL